MKKFLGIMLAVLMLSVSVFAADITVTLNGEVVDCESYGSPATIVEGRTLVPLRAIFEALGATVEWDQATKTVSSTLGKDSISLAVGSTTLVKNGQGITLDVPAQIINSRTMVPARAIAEAYGVGVEWNAATRTVVLTQAKDNKGDTPADGIIAYSGVRSGDSENLHIVADPTDPSNEVYYLESIAGEEQSWTYIWFPAKYEAGKRYIVNFDVYLDSDATGGTIEADNASVGICFAYGDSTLKNGYQVQHGETIDKKPSNSYPTIQEWTHVTYIYEMPTTLNSAKMEFGIYGNPVAVPGMPNKLAVNYYVDNITVEVYEGTAENGIQA